MKITKETMIHCVTDPTPVSVFDDVLWTTDLGGLELNILGGGIESRPTDRNLTIYTDYEEARRDAMSRLALQI